MNRNRYRVRGNGNNPNAPTKKFNFLGGTLPSGLTLARASTATFINGGGLLATAAINAARFEYDITPLIERNLCTSSDVFTGAQWTKTNTTVSQITTVANPFGENRTTVLTDNATSGQHFLQSAFTPTTGTITASVYLKQGTARYIQLAWQGTGGVYLNIDLLTGTKTAGSASTWSIVDAGNGWWRCSITMTGTTGNYIYVVHTGDNPTAAGSPIYTGTGLTVYVWGAQIEVGSTATIYKPSLASFNGFSSSQNRGNRSFAVDLSSFNNDQTSLVNDSSVASFDGSYPAKKAVPSSTTAWHSVSPNVGSSFAPWSGVWTGSIYAKAGEYSRIAVGFMNNGGGSGRYSVFNLSTRTIVDDQAIAGGGVVLSCNGYMQDVGNGWFRCSVVIKSTSGIRFGFTSTNADTMFFAGNGSSGCYVYGPQIEEGTAANTFINTNRVGSIKGLLIEEARTNLCLQSNSLGAVGTWVPTNCTATKANTGMNGSINSCSTVTSSAASATIYQTITQAAANAIFSCYIKRRSGTGTIQITQDGGLTTTDATALINDTYWTRIQTPVQAILNPVIGIIVSASGDAVDVDGCQFENVFSANAVASSQIVTFSATVTRSADTAKASSITWINAPTGAVYIDATTGAVTTTATAFNLYNSASATTNHIKVQNDSATTLVGSLAANTTAVTTTPLAVSANQRIKAAISYTSGNNLFSLNGSAPATSGAFFTAGVATGLNTLEVGSETGTNQFNGWIREFRYYKKAKTAAQIQALTT